MFPPIYAGQVGGDERFGRCAQMPRIPASIPGIPAITGFPKYIDVAEYMDNRILWWLEASPAKWAFVVTGILTVLVGFIVKTFIS